MFKKFLSAVKAHSFLNSEEMKAYLPKQFIAADVPLFEAEPNAGQTKLYQELEYLAVNDRFSEIATIVHESYRSGNMVGPGIYECEYLIEPLENVSGSGDGCPTIPQTERAAKRFGHWYAQEPENPYAAAFAAKSLFEHGYAHRGTDWAHNVTEEGREKLQEYTALALDVIEKSADTCSENWFWRKAYLDLVISDYRGPEDHYMRFEKAWETLPNSRDLWTSFAYQLLPRWFGSEPELRKLQNKAYEMTKDQTGDVVFLSIMNLINRFEGMDMDYLPDFKIMREVADNRATMSDDKSLTIACGLYCWLGHEEPIAELMPRIETFNECFWYYPHEPDYMTAVSVLNNRRRDKRAA
ncbi:MAG: hypothetical protein QNJ29_03240 [Rhizobiaceae bacterium]|nr:hypothetical protein [Rhizobiaceae bacterium]